uniref:Putative nuclear receptor coactivator 5 strongylocentrotus purpuratus n=1 Tax=Amblyomma aureolatum TaxID=187763 RepID=A0A1E1XA81_9ACAR
MDTHMSSDTSDPAKASSRIYVGNLKKHIEREDLQKLFSKYGEIQGISLHKGGFGFVQFKEEDEAEAAVKGEGGIFFKGCLLQLRVCSSQDVRRSYRGSSRERDREYSDHDRRHEASMPRDRSPVHRDYDEREFKRDDRPPPTKPYDRSPPRRGDDYSSDRRFGRDEGRYGREAPPYGGRGDDYLRGGPGGPPSRDSHSRYSREDRYGGRDERGYGRDDPPRPYPRPEGNGRYVRDGYWAGRDDYGHLGRDEPPMGYGRDEPHPPRGRMEAVPVPPPFRPEANLRKPNDCEIIVLHRQNRNYAEMVERRLKNLGMQVDLLFLKDEALLSRALEDLTQRGTLFAVVVTDQHEVHGSVTVNILYGVPQEHRNMPLDDSLKLVARHFREQVEAQQTAAGGPDRLGPDRELQFLLKLLVDSKYLSIPELDRVIKYLTERRDKQLMLERGESAHQQPRTVSSTVPSANVEPERPKPPVEEEKPTQQELQQRILSMIGQPGPISPTTIVKQAPLPTPVQPQQQAPAAAPASDVPTSTYINFDNPSVQKALDNLIHNGSNLLKTLSGANSSGASPALSSQQPAKPPSGYGYGDGEAYGGSAPGINNSFGGHAGQQYQQPPPLLRGPGGPTTPGAMRHPLMGTQVQRPMMSAGRPGGGMPRY